MHMFSLSSPSHRHIFSFSFSESNFSKRMFAFKCPYFCSRVHFLTLHSSRACSLAGRCFTGTALPEGPRDLLAAESSSSASASPPLVLYAAQRPALLLLLWSFFLTLCHLCVSQRSALDPVFLLPHALFSENLIHPTSSTNAHMQMSLYAYFQPRPLL